MSEKRVSLPLETMQQILNTLGSMPYNSVAELISVVRQNLRSVEETSGELDAAAGKRAEDVAGAGDNPAPD